LLQQAAPEAAILINLQISLTNSQLTEEGGTLSQTLMPFVDRVTDYSFIPADASHIMCRFLQSLIRHVADAQDTVGTGFILFALRYSPPSLVNIIQFPGNAAALKEALIHMQYQHAAAEAISKHPRKFLW